MNRSQNIKIMKSAEVPSPDPIPTEKRDKNYKFGYKNCKTL